MRFPHCLGTLLPLMGQARLHEQSLENWRFSQAEICLESHECVVSTLPRTAAPVQISAIDGSHLDRLTELPFFLFLFSLRRPARGRCCHTKAMACSPSTDSPSGKFVCGYVCGWEVRAVETWSVSSRRLRGFCILQQLLCSAGMGFAPEIGLRWVTACDSPPERPRPAPPTASPSS